VCCKFGYFLFHAFSMKPQKDHSTGNSGSSAAGHISEAVNEGLVNGYVDVLNGHIGAWLETVAHQRTHGTTGAKPQVLLDEERFTLQSLPSPTHPVTPLTISDSVMPLESFQHPLSTYDALLEVRP
jgi:hypothetical protein